MADLTPLTPSNEVTLGRSTSGSRRWDVVFTWTAECTLAAGGVTATIRVLQGSDASIDGDKITLSTTADSNDSRLVISLSIPRNPDVVPAGKFEGQLELNGPGIEGIGTALVTIRHQEPLTIKDLSGLQQLLWIAVGLIAIVALLFVRQKKNALANDLTIAPLLFVGAVTLYPLVAHLWSSRVPALWWPLWLGALGVVGGLIVAVLKHRTAGEPLEGGYRFGAAMVLSVGAGLAAWRSQYLNSPDWAFTMESALSLVGVVGGATVTAALLLLAPNAQPSIALATEGAITVATGRTGDARTV